MRRLLLLRHATTDAVRRAAFPCDEPLDAAGAAAASALAGRLGRAEALSAPTARARDTARLAGFDPRPVDALAGCDVAAWRGRTLEEVDGAAAWRADPDAAPHGGESLRAFVTRVGAWLAGQASASGRAVAVCDADVVKAAVVRALDAPLEAFWRIDVAPLGVTELHTREGRWTVAAVNAEVGP